MNEQLQQNPYEGRPNIEALKNKRQEYIRQGAMELLDDKKILNDEQKYIKDLKKEEDFSPEQLREELEILLADKVLTKIMNKHKLDEMDEDRDDKKYEELSKEYPFVLIKEEISRWLDSSDERLKKFRELL